MKKHFLAIMVVTSLASTIMAAPKSAIQFWDTIGTKQTALFGWSGDSATGKFFIEAPKGTEALNVQNGQVNVNGAINATAVRGDGNNLTNINPASHAHSQYINKQQSDSSITKLLTTKADTGRTIAATKITGVLDTNQYQFGQYAIPSQGTTGQVWKSDGNGRGVWGTDSVGSATTSGVTSVGGSPAIDAATAAGAVTVSVKTGGIASAMLADSAVTGVKIKSNAIQTSHIADNQITSAKILNATIVQADLSAELSAKVDKGEAIGTYKENMNNGSAFWLSPGSTSTVATVTIVVTAPGVIILNGSAQIMLAPQTGEVVQDAWFDCAITQNTTDLTNQFKYTLVAQATEYPANFHQTRGFTVTTSGSYTYTLVIWRAPGSPTTGGVRNPSLTAIYIRQ